MGKHNPLGWAASPATSIYFLSREKKLKLFHELAWCCFRCGWNETTCEIHHINGRKVEDPHHHRNLTYICPNCHHCAHREIVSLKDLPSIEDLLPEDWRDIVKNDPKPEKIKFFSETERKKYLTILKYLSKDIRLTVKDMLWLMVYESRDNIRRDKLKKKAYRAEDARISREARVAIKKLSGRLEK